VNRADRGPLFLIAAGVLMLLAVVAYLINDAEDQSRRMEAALERQALDAQSRRTVSEMRALRGENDRTRRERDRIRAEHVQMLESLDRIEKRLGGASPPATGRGRPGSVEMPARASGAVPRPALRADQDRHPL